MLTLHHGSEVYRIIKYINFVGVLSRNNFLSITHISSVKQQNSMKKLNQKKIKWIVKDGDKGDMGFYSISQVQNITPRWAREVHRKYKGIKEPKLLPCGRKPKPIADDERKMVINAYNEFQVGATMIEQILDERGIHINHNKIHRILLEAKLAKHELKKKNRRKWVRYERKHSLRLGHADWFTFRGKECILFIDDASRFIPAYGEFENANIENTIKVFKQTLKYGIFKQQLWSSTYQSKS